MAGKKHSERCTTPKTCTTTHQRDCTTCSAKDGSHCGDHKSGCHWRCLREPRDSSSTRSYSQHGFHPFS